MTSRFLYTAILCLHWASYSCAQKAVKTFTHTQNKQGASTTYQPSWKSLERHDEVPEWVRDAKFGIYAHWGVYAVPAYNNEHYIQHMHNEADYAKLGTHKRHLAVYGPLSEFGYHDFIPEFKGEKFSAEEWADLFVKGGARFAGPVAEHHDGFAMWDSEVTPFNAKDMGPKRDIVGELEKAIRKRGLKFFTSLHHELNYTNVKVKPTWEAADPKYAKLYGSPMPEKEWQQMWLDKCLEVVNKYHPDMIYHDAWLEQVDEEKIRTYLAHYFNEAASRNQEVTVTSKGGDIPYNVGMEDHENSNPEQISKSPFLSDYSIGEGFSFSWGYTEGMGIRTAKDIVHKLVEIVSNNGQMLLNLSPKADGTIPEDQRQVVTKIGMWLWTFGEAIYETRPFRVSGEKTEGGKRVHYTQKGKDVYIIFLDWPGGEGEMTTQKDMPVSLKQLTAGNLNGKVKAVTLLGLKKLENIPFNATSQGLTITIPAKTRVPSEIAHVFKVEIE
ncbi:alpha-L-fucosidase [Rufibacter tibetensis]|uniref:alpha-L-fucosidase n=1 Tax=Rufibacter tibetensis TaxID=512763 RepID=UPI0007819BB1|nr:alpha-L-fucosidase [Rufibacter tibetensis]